MKKLLIVESSTKIKTISKFLSSEFYIAATGGHIIDLPTKKLGLKINKDNSIEPEYEIMKGKEKVIKDLQKYLQKRDIKEIYLAPDPDREGEIIAFHINQILLDKIKEPVNIARITFNEITKKAILESLSKPRKIDENLINAQQARRILDRLVGYKVSPILWKKVANGLSAGRVQSVALKLIFLREKEIKSFIVEEYWSIHPVLIYKDKEYTATLFKYRNKKIDSISPDLVNNITHEVEKEKEWIISDIKESKRTKKPLAPFITSTLQQSAYNKLGFSVTQTMIIAQSLYEGINIEGDSKALVTYIRTDSPRVSQTALSDVRSFIKKSYGQDYCPSVAFSYGKADAQDAHEAIRPIDVSYTPDFLKNKIDKNTHKLYTLIWSRFVASQMESAQFLSRTIEFSTEKGHYAKLTGSTITFDGFLKIYNIDEEDEEKNSLPKDFEKGRSITLKKVERKQHFTQPPARYSEATLVKELEGKGIGRPSTYASILKTIRDRLYTKLDEKKRFIPTELGNTVAKILDENFSDIMNIDFTAKMEENLDKIAEGKETRKKIVEDFYLKFQKDLEVFENKKIEKSLGKTSITCPTCNKFILVIKMGKNGEFLGCSNYPDCSFTGNFITNEKGEIELNNNKKEKELLDEKCPKCLRNLCNKKGKYGSFIACSGYPDCVYIHKKVSTVNCPGCNKNKLAQKRWKNNIFWSCVSYPECRYCLNGDLLEESCPLCNFTFLKIDKKGFIVCANKECKYEKEN